MTQYCFESVNLILNRNTESTEFAESTGANENINSVLIRIGRYLINLLLGCDLFIAKVFEIEM